MFGEILPERALPMMMITKLGPLPLSAGTTDGTPPTKKGEGEGGGGFFGSRIIFFCCCAAGEREEGKEEANWQFVFQPRTDGQVRAESPSFSPSLPPPPTKGSGKRQRQRKGRKRKREGGRFMRRMHRFPSLRTKKEKRGERNKNRFLELGANKSPAHTYK